MDKRYKLHNEEQRPLCIGDINTCINLADYKETRNGIRKYKTLCSKHRRPKNQSVSFNNPRSKRHIPLVDCSLCESTKSLERHRVMRGMPYTPKQVVVLCQSCHNFVHKFETILNGKNFYIRRTRILKSKFETA